MISCKPCDMPTLAKSKVTLDEQPYLDPTFYRRLVSALQYLTITCPDLAFTINTMCQFMYMPQQSHF